MSADGLYDVIVVGGGPVGMATAYQCAVKRSQKVAVIEQFEKGHKHGSSPGFSRQFRTCYSELHLCKLAVKTSKLWDELMRDLNNTTLLDRTGCLWFGDPAANSSEGNIEQAKRNLDELGEPYKYIDGKEEIVRMFPFIAGALTDDIKEPKALFTKDGGTINVPALLTCLVDAVCKTGALLVENANVTSIDSESEHPVIKVSTSNGQLLRGKKVILTPGAYVNHVLSTLKPVFTQRIKSTIYLWSSAYFQVTREPPDDDPSHSSKWPIWYFFGKPKEITGSEHIDGNCFYGFPSDTSDKTGHARVCPAFTSISDFDFTNYPPTIEERSLDDFAVKFTGDFIQRSMPDLDYTLVDDKMSTCIAGFTEMASGEDEKSAGFVVDFVPNTDKRIVLATGGWCMKYVPVMGIILSELALDGETVEYGEEIKPMNIARALISAVKLQELHVKLTALQRAAKFNRLWS